MARVAGRREITVADVARAAGVSRAHAARALGDYGAVSDGVRSRVLAAADLLGYRPNALARTLTTGRSLTIGVVLGDIENPYFSLATRGISDAIEREGLTLLLANTSERVDAERAAVEMLMDKRVDGLIVAPASATEIGHLRSVLRHRRPLVLLDRTVVALGVDTATADLGPAARAAGAHLLDLGHRRVGYLTTATGTGLHADDDHPLPSPVAMRVAGLVDAFADRDLVWDRSLLRSAVHDEDAIMAAAVGLLDSGASAVIASDSLIGLAVIAALQSVGARIPDDVSVLMYDDQPWARLLDPPITVVSQPTYEIGYAAGARLAARIAGRTELPPLVPLPSSLVVRGSTAAVSEGLDVG